jgi:hypothetical protein
MSQIIVEKANDLLHSVVQRHLLPQWKKATYEGFVLDTIQDTIRDATGDIKCTVHLEGYVMHGGPFRNTNSV